MKKFLLVSSFVGVLAFTGCQQIQDTAQNLRQEGEKTYSGLSQQAENVKAQAIQTKDAYDKKAKDVGNAVEAVNKVLK
jgi:hypothetical protein